MNPEALTDESIFSEPLNTEPNSDELTTNPKPLSTDAVTEPDDIRTASSVRADCGILNNPAPSPKNKDADIESLILTEPVNSEPLSADFTTNPLFKSTDTAMEPVINLLNLQQRLIKMHLAFHQIMLRMVYPLS